MEKREDGFLARFAYPLLALREVRETNFHNLVMQVFTFGICLTTLVLAMERGGGRTLVAVKAVHAALILAAALITGVALALSASAQEHMRRPISLLSFGVAVVTVVLAIAVVFARLETGTLWWLEAIVTVTNLFWIWRTAQQSTRC